MSRIDEIRERFERNHFESTSGGLYWWSDEDALEPSDVAYLLDREREARLIIESVCAIFPDAGKLSKVQAWLEE